MVGSISVGLDFGTSRSGFSYRAADGEVKVRQKWPGKTGQVYCKTLTAILYEFRGGRYEVAAWGWEALERYSSLASPATGSHVYVDRFKLHLAEDVMYTNMTLPALPDGKTARDVVSDFLECLKNCALEDLDNAHDRPDRSNISWVLTVPAGWSQAAMQTMREAATRAGIIPTEKDERLKLLYEPEAAAISTLSSVPSLSANDSLVVIDAGGGTIDITAHKVTQVGSQWKLEESSVRKGILKGSTFLDSFFEDYLCELLGGRARYATWAKDFPQDRLKLLHKKWEEQKMSFEGKNDAIIEVPRSLVKLFQQVPSSNPLDDDDALVIPAAEMRELFDQLLDDIIEEVCSFINKLGGCDLVVLVGGFGESKYLLDRLGEVLGDRAIKVTSPGVPSQAVLSGAARYGQNQTMIATRRSPFAFGVESTGVWTPAIREDLKFWHAAREAHYYNKCFVKMVECNEPINFDQAVTKHFWPMDAFQERLPFKIYMTRDNNAQYTDAGTVHLLGEVELVIADPTTVTNPDKYTLEVKLMFGSTELKVSARDLQTDQEVTANLHFISGTGLRH